MFLYYSVYIPAKLCKINVNYNPYNLTCMPILPLGSPHSGIGPENLRSGLALGLGDIDLLHTEVLSLDIKVTPKGAWGRVGSKVFGTLSN